MALFAAYGLVLASDFELPGLHSIEDGSVNAPDVFIRRGEARAGPTDGDWYSLHPSHSQLVWDGVCRLSIEGGSKIVVTPTGGDPRLLGHVLLGPAMGLLLQQRGCFPLHASAVEIGGAAVAFAGDSGAGKSTLAQAMCKRGHRLVTDDIAALEVAGETTVTRPGHAALRLWPDSLERQGLEPSDFSRLHAETEKRLFEVHDTARALGAPLHRLERVYVLKPSDHFAIEELDGLAKALTLVRHVCYPELMSGAIGPSALLEQCVEISATTRVFGVDRPNGPDGLAQMAELIEGST